MTKSYQIEGLENLKTAAAIEDGVKRIMGVEGLHFDLQNATLDLELSKPNALMKVLVEHVVKKEDETLVVKELS